MIRYHARWILPITSPPIADGTVVVDDGRIAYAGSRSGAPAGKDHELGDVALLPGLVNGHTHLELTVMRGALEDLEFHEWIAALRARWEQLTPEMLLDSARRGIVEGLRYGMTTFADTCASGMAAQALSEARVRGLMYQEVFGPDPARCDPVVAEARARLTELRKHESPLVRIGLSPHAAYTVSDVLYAAVARLATEERVPIATHVAESESETLLVTQGSGPFADGLRARGIATPRRARSPIGLLASTGVLRDGTLLIHCVRVDPEDIAAIAGSGAAVVHCPISNAKLGHGIAPIAELLAAGVPVALGSDSVASNNRMDLLDEARCAILLQRARTARCDVLDARAALEMATMGGARALGLADRIGSLEAGKEADLVAFSLDGVLPVGDPETALLFSLPRRETVFACVAGHVLVANGRVSGDTPELRTSVAASQS